MLNCDGSEEMSGYGKKWLFKQVGNVVVSNDWIV